MSSNANNNNNNSANSNGNGNSQDVFDFENKKKGKRFIFRDVKNPGVAGGEYVTAKTWQKRELNTVINSPTSFATLDIATSIITLEAGVWRLVAKVPAYRLINFKSRLFNITTNSVVEYGTTEFNYFSQTNSIIDTKFEIETTQQFQIEVFGSYKYGGNMCFGVPCNIPDVNEIYTDVMLRKIV